MTRTTTPKMDSDDSIIYIERTIGEDDKLLHHLLEDALDWAHCHGLALRTSDHKDRSDVCQAAPLALFPSPFPRELFETAYDIQKAMNEIYLRVALDYDFLIEAHKEVCATDDFIRHMCNILSAVNGEGNHQPLTLLTQRADYMPHVNAQGQVELKQIEVNNIAVSMGGLGQLATLLHRRMLSKVGVGQEEVKKRVPDNRPISTLANGIYKAWQLFDRSEGILLVIVDPVNQNQLDQRFVEYEVERLSSGGVKVVRLTLAQCDERLLLSEDDGSFSLYVNPPHSQSLDTAKGDASKQHQQLLVGVVYFRSGYTPQNYPTEVEWRARMKIERSAAIKCPWIGLQLANTKKMQQVLSDVTILKRYLPGYSEGMIAKVHGTFAGLWGLEYEDEQTQAIISDAIAYPENYVLKPQMEGGGGNYYNNEIPVKLRELSLEERGAHILMERVRPLVFRNYLIRPFQQPTLTRSVTELGVYGCLIAKGAEILENVVQGHLLRTKAEDCNEGGVAVGAAVIDTPYLY